MPDRDTVRFNDLLDDSSCMISHIMNSIDAPVAPVDQVGLLKDRRRPGRIHDVSPALIQLLRNPPGVAVVDDSVPMPEANEVASRSNRLFSSTSGIWTWVSLGVGMSTAAIVWFATGHGSWTVAAVGNLLSLLYGLGLLM
jgi:hypothetical protein